RGRALKSGESYGEGEKLQTPRRLNYGTAQDPLPICEEEELTRTKSTIRTAVQRDRSSNRVNLHDGLYTVYLRETEKRNSHRPEDSKTTTEGLEDGKEGSWRGSDALRFRQTTPALPLLSLRRAEEVQRRKAYRSRWRGEGLEREAKERKKKKLGWRRRPVQQACHRSPPPDLNPDVDGA
ncbi:hypothetical protein HID58_019778, partial [Brassica napus]